MDSRADPPPYYHAWFENRPPNFLVLAAWAASRELHDGPRRLPDGPRLHQDAPRRPKRAPRRTQRAPSRPKIASRRPKRAPSSPRRPPRRPTGRPGRAPGRQKSIIFLRFSYVFGMSAISHVDASKTAQYGPKTAARRSKMAPRRLNSAQDGPKIVPCWLEDASGCLQDGPKSLQDSPKTAQDASRWL